MFSEIGTEDCRRRVEPALAQGGVAGLAAVRLTHGAVTT
jgi:hypothetical protein